MTSMVMMNHLNLIINNTEEMLMIIMLMMGTMMVMMMVSLKLSSYLETLLGRTERKVKEKAEVVKEDFLTSHSPLLMQNKSSEISLDLICKQIHYNLQY